MEPHSLKWVGSPCGLHGPYVFYKAFKFHLEGKPRILSLGDFFFVRCKPGDPICIAELQLLWEERTTKQLLSSSKLYFLPEDTPQGRSVSQGEDEILAVSEKVIVKLDNLVRWTVLDASQWSRGLKAVPLKPSVLKELGKNGRREALHRYCESTLNSGLNFRDVLKEKAQLGEDENDLKRVLVLSYPRYCRYRSVIARLRERPSSLLTDQVVLALGGIASLNGNTRILYCRDTFEHPTLVQNESISDQFDRKRILRMYRIAVGFLKPFMKANLCKAPNLKGRPRKKKPSVSQRQDSQSSAKDISNTDTSAPAKVKSDPKAVVTKLKNGGSGGKKALVEVRAKARTETGQGEEQAFLVSLYQYMKERGTPIERIPYLGFKQIDLWTMFQTAQQLGGYEPITARRQWKNVYDQLGGNPGSTSAATCTRRHYERLLLPYERYIKGEDHQPRPQLQPKPLDRDVLECDGTVKTKEGKQLKITPNRKAPAEVDTFRKSPEPALVADGQESTHPVARATELRRNSLEEDEEEFRLVLKEQTPRCDAMEERTPPTESSSEVRAIGGLSEDLEYLQGYPEPQARGAPDVDLTEAKFSPQFHPSLTHVCAASQSDSRLDPPTATEASVHVGHIPPTLKEKLPLASTDEEQPHPCISCRTVAPPAGTAGIMSPLAKKKLLAQVSGGGVPANSYPFSTPFPAEALGNHNGGSAISRPSVIQHAGNRKRNVTSELFQPDLAPPGPAGGQCQAEKSTGPLFYGSNFPNLHPTHPLLSLHRQGECCLSRDALFSRNGLNGYRFSPNLYSDRTGPGCRPSLTEKPNLPGAEVPSEDQPTDLSLPKSSPPNPPPCQPGLCSLNTPALHRDSPSPLLPATTMDCHPEACCIPTMSVSMPRKLLDAPRPLRKDFVLGHHFVGPVGCGPHQNMFGPHPIRQTMEELDRGPPEKKIRMVAPMHSMQPRTPDTDSNDKLGDRPVGGLKLPARTPLFHPLNPSAQEMCDRSGPATGAGYPLQCLKSQAVVTPLLPPFTLHSLMVQRQLLASATPHLYGPPSGTSYRDFLHHHNLFPMSALTPPPTFTTPQISSLHPSTKL